MRGPKHLWTGDWERESAAASEELASLEELPRVEAWSPEPVAALGEPDLPAPRSRPRWPRRQWRLPRLRVPVPSRRARWATAATVALLCVLGGVAYGVAALIDSGGATQSARVRSGPSTAMWWLGMQIESFPNGGAVIVTVPPGSLGEAAGLEPGDVIVQVGSRQINSGGDVAKAVAGMRVGQTVPVEVSRGSTLVRTSAILGAPPSNSP